MVTFKLKVTLFGIKRNKKDLGSKKLLTLFGINLKIDRFSEYIHMKMKSFFKVRILYLS